MVKRIAIQRQLAFGPCLRYFEVRAAAAFALGKLGGRGPAHGGLRSIRSITSSFDRFDRFDRFNFFQLFSNFKFQLARAGAGLGTAVGPGGLERRSVKAVPQPWPIEI